MPVLNRENNVRAKTEEAPIITKEAMEMQNKQNMMEVDKSLDGIDQQIERDFKRYEQAKRDGRLEDAKRYLKAFTFMSKMKTMVTRFKETLELLDNVEKVFSIFSTTSETFAKLVGTDHTTDMKSMKKNIKKFQVQIRQYELQMDQMTSMFDDVFAERQNPIARFFNKIFGKKKSDPQDDLSALEQQAAKFMDGKTTTTTATDSSTPAAAPGSSSDDITIL